MYTVDVLSEAFQKKRKNSAANMVLILMTSF